MTNKEYLDNLQIKFAELYHMHWINWSYGLATKLKHWHDSLDENDEWGDLGDIKNDINYTLSHWKKLWVPLDELKDEDRNIIMNTANEYIQKMISEEINGNDKESQGKQ